MSREGKVMELEDALFERECQIPIENNDGIFPLKGEAGIVIYTLMNDARLRYEELPEEIESVEELNGIVPKGATPRLLAYSEAPTRPDGTTLPLSDEVA